MHIHDEFQEFLKLLNRARVECLVVGGYAVAFHGHVRMTKDLDIFFRNTGDNIAKIIKALAGFGLAGSNVNTASFSEPGAIIRIGVSPVQIEMINAISGITFDTAWARSVVGRYGNVKVRYLSYADLIKNKTASGRPQDLADVAALKNR
jgi:hypothetical protein